MILKKIQLIISKNFLLKSIFNPFFVLGASFLLALVLFFFRWSDTYPKVELELLLFIISTIIISFLLGYSFRHYKYDIPDIFDYNKFLKLLYVLSFLSFASFGLTFWVKGMPFYIILFTDNVFSHLQYTGIKTLTISGITLNAVCVMFYSIIFIKTKKTFVLIALLLSFIPLILLFNRSVFFITVLPISFLVLKTINKKWFILLIGALILGFYVFGSMGDKRENSKRDIEEDRFYTEFMGSNYPKFLPKQFFWGYFYISSPIAKLQFTLNDPIIQSQPTDISKGIVFEILPSSIGLRIADYKGWERRVSNFGYHKYFVGTCFGRIYFYWKWPGLIVYLFLFLGFIYLSIKTLRKKNNWIKTPIICILNSMMLLSVFTNMLTFTAFYIMAFWVILIFYIARKKGFVNA